MEDVMRKTFLMTLFLIITMTCSAFGAYDIEQYLNIKYARGGSFSPDEKTIAYLSNESGTYQVWKLDVESGKTKQLTNFEDSVGMVRYSPKESTLLFAKDTDGDENYQLYIMNDDGSNPIALTADPKSRFLSPLFSPNGKKIAYTSNERNKEFFDIYVMDLETKTSKLVRKVNAFNTVEAWSPDGGRLIVATHDNNYNNNLRSLNLATEESFLLTPHEGWATYQQIAWPKGKEGEKGFYLVSDKSQEFSKLCFYKFKKALLEVLDGAQWNTENLCMSENGRVLGYTLNINGYSKMVLIDTKKDMYWAKPDLPAGVVENMSISKKGDKVLFTFSSPAHNWDLWLYDKKTDTTKRLTHSSTAGIDPNTFVKPEPIRYPSTYGLEIPAYLYMPKGTKKGDKLPVILYAHGGPESQERPDFGTTFQYFLNRGFAVFAPNVRGSDGYGKTFLHLDDKAQRINSVLDAVYGVNYLIEHGYADPNRIGVYGGSYGGFMVLALMTEHPKMFAAGVDVVGISNFVTFLERTSSYRRKLREAEYGSLDKDRQLLEQISPIHKISKIQGALMVVHGAKDPRVPKHEADQVVEKAKEAGVEVVYLLYEDEGHGLRKLSNKLDAYPKIAAFMEKYLMEKVKEPKVTKEPGDEPEKE